MSNDPIRESITGFYQKISEAHDVLTQEGYQIEDRKEKLLALLRTGIQLPSPPDGRSEQAELCRGMLSEAGEALSDWQRMIEAQIERSEFVNRYEKSVLTLVFADVNAGKSTLGNFVSGYNLQGTPYADLYRAPKFKIEDFSEASTEDRSVRSIDCFAENAVEATSTIQHFTLADGLTWVDTPGLHSLTVKNGKLAQEYIQFADLVVYLTPSSSPFKMDERDMLRDLFRRGKPVILAITKSDESKNKPVQGKVVRVPRAKPKEKREAQETYGAEEVRKLGGEDLLKNSRFLSLSVRLAREAVRNQDFALYRDSNLDSFFEQMGDILSREAMSLKMQRPRAEVNDCIHRLVGTPREPSAGTTQSICQIRALLSERTRVLQDLIESCSGESERILAEIEQQLPYALDAPFRGLRSRGQLGSAELVRQETTQVVMKLTEDVCARRLKRILGEVVRAAQLPALSVSAASEVSYQVTTRERSKTVTEERSPRGLLEHIHRWINPDVKFYKTYQDTDSIAVGDNYNAFLDAQIQALRPDLRRYVDEAVQAAAKECIRPVLTCYQELDRQMEKLAEDLKAVAF